MAQGACRSAANAQKILERRDDARVQRILQGLCRSRQPTGTAESTGGAQAVQAFAQTPGMQGLPTGGQFQFERLQFAGQHPAQGTNGVETAGRGACGIVVEHHIAEMRCEDFAYALQRGRFLKRIHKAIVAQCGAASCIEFGAGRDRRRDLMQRTQLREQRAALCIRQMAVDQQ